MEARSALFVPSLRLVAARPTRARRPAPGPRPLARVACAALGLIALLATSGPAAAQDMAYRVRDRVAQGGPGPALILSPPQTLRRVTLHLRRGDGKRIVLKADRIPAHSEHEFVWDQSLGVQTYEAALTATTSGGDQRTFKLSFQVEVQPPLRLEVLPELVDVAQRRIGFRANRALTRVELSVEPAEGVPVQVEKAIAPEAARADQVLEWPAVEGKLRRVRLRAYDDQGFWSEQEFSPWWVEVEHEEVTFDSGKATFAPSEEAKLDRSLQRIREILGDEGADLPVQLYIAGYTDTVGSVESNQALSVARARAIAAHFRKRGLHLPMYCQGFGEQVLAEATADEVDEPRNRRALYVLGTSPPPRSGALPRAEWQKL